MEEITKIKHGEELMSQLIDLKSIETDQKKVVALKLAAEAPREVRKIAYGFIGRIKRNLSDKENIDFLNSLLALIRKNDFDVSKTLRALEQEIINKKHINVNEDKKVLKDIADISLKEATPSKIKDLLRKNKNIPSKEYSTIIRSVKKQEKRGNTKETQESLLNSGIQSWNNFYNIKALPQAAKIRILPSESKDFRRSHAKRYYQIITVRMALKLGFFINNCRCGYQLV
ncbi:MAG: hypothetical protein FWE18_00105 [Alphaproteobacteria bacterium]|nr:hypothetical protein [Alphaproteobacteria bacterium]